MRKLIFLAAPVGFAVITAMWASYLPTATNQDAPTEFLWGAIGTLAIFAPLHAGLWLEYRRGSPRQLPALILIVLMTTWLIFAVGFQPRYERSEFPWDGTILIPTGTLFLLLFPLYLLALILAWILHRVFGVRYALHLYDKS